MSRKNYTSQELEKLQRETIALHNDITQDIKDGKLEVYKGILVPKQYANARNWDMVKDNVWHEEDKVYYTRFYWLELGEPEGPLPVMDEAAALFLYCLKAFKQWHLRTQQLQLEDTPDQIIHYGNLLRSTARAYQVEPNDLPAYWPAVQKAFKLMYDREVPPPVYRGTQSILHPYLN